MTEPNAATEVVMPLDTLRMFADQLHTVLVTFVEGESWVLDLEKVWKLDGGALDEAGRARGLLREILSSGRAKLVELQGTVERLEDLMRRYTQTRDARNGQRHTLAEDIRMAALEALLPEELERHCQLQRSRLDTYQKLREEVVLHAEARGYVAPKLGQVSKAREDRDDPMDVGGFGQWKGRDFPEGKGNNSTGIGKGKGTGEDGKDGAKSSGRVNTPKTQSQCWNCRQTGQYKDCFVNLADGHSNKVKDIQILLERGRASQSKVVERKENPKMLEHLCGINSRVQQRAQWHRLHHRQRQAQRLARLTQLNAQRWICARLHWHSRKL